MKMMLPRRVSSTTRRTHRSYYPYWFFLLVILLLGSTNRGVWKCKAVQLDILGDDDHDEENNNIKNNDIHKNNVLPGGFKWYPKSIHLRAGVIEDHPFAMIDELPDGTYNFSGFEPDFVDRLVEYARLDGVNLTIELFPAPTKYNVALSLVGYNCNTTENPHPLEDCNKFDMIVGDYFINPQRFQIADFTPSWLTATMSSIRYLDKPAGEPDYATIDEVEKAGAKMCLLDSTYVTRTVMSLYPNLNVHTCHIQHECTELVKNLTCALYADDSTQLNYRATLDPSLALSPQQFKPQFFGWPFKFSLPEVTKYLLKRWVYLGTATGDLGDLYHKYFEAKVCPVGTAGKPPECDLPCDPDRGRADKRTGRCVCISTKWSGEDCSIEVPEDLNLIPAALKTTGYIMFGINAALCGICAIWLVWKWKAPQVSIAQPLFLGLVLVGCIISSSTILALSAEDEGDGPVHACMAIPWLYSIGFSITFGSLFAKILRVHRIFVSAAELRRIEITTFEALSNIMVVLVIDVILLVVWTLIDPLHWQRTVIAEDKFGDPLESVGFCTSDHWAIFAGLIAGLHFIVLSVACYVCYVTRNISDRLAESKYLAIAMVSNFQILLVGIPVLIIIGADPHTSFFVRSVMIWMNDLVVVCLIFGNIMHGVHFRDKGHSSNVLVRRSIQSYISRKNVNSRVSNKLSTNVSGLGFSTNASGLGPDSSHLSKQFSSDGNSHAFNTDGSRKFSDGSRKFAPSDAIGTGWTEAEPEQPTRSNKDGPRKFVPSDIDGPRKPVPSDVLAGTGWTTVESVEFPRADIEKPEAPRLAKVSFHEDCDDE